MEIKEFSDMAYELYDMEDYTAREIRQKQHETDRPQANGRFPYIPFTDDSTLFTLFEILREECGMSKVKFLDVGCGTGRIVKLALNYGFPVVNGVEIHQPYIDYGNKLYGFTNNELIQGNAFELSQEFVRQFNVIYTYKPLCNSNYMRELHINLYNKASSGTFFVEMLPDYYPMTIAHDCPLAIFKGIARGRFAAVYKNYAYD